MKKRSPSLPLLVLVALVALLVGSAGTAVAGPALTKGKVTKIATKTATKIVRKLAPSLTVAAATNATNAANLDGQPAAAYRTRAFTVPIPNASSVSSFNRTLPPIPAGTYQASLYVTATVNTAGAVVACGLYQQGATAELLDVYAAQYSSGRTLQGTRIITIPANATLHVACSPSSGTLTIPADAGYGAPQLQFLRVDEPVTLAPAS